MQFRDFQYYMPVKLVFEKGGVGKLGEEAKKLGSRALVISYGSNDWAQQNYCIICDLLQEYSVEVVGFATIDPEPGPDSIDRVADQFANLGVDIVVSMGGGSVLDAAKGVAVILTFGGKTWDFVGRGKVPGEVIPIIAIPTTAGTGSEVTPYAIFKNKALNRKAGIISPHIFPKIAILDPEVTLGLPSRLTAVSGIDAFAHALESFTSPIRNGMSVLASRQALALIGSNLKTAILHGDNLEARAGMLLGSSLAGIGIAHAGTGIAHAVGATLGGFYPLEHGWLVGLVLPEAIRYNTPVAKDLYHETARLIGLDVEGISPEETSEKLACQVEEWLDISGLATRLSSMGVQQEMIPAMIEDTSTQNSVGNNIRRVDKTTIERFYQRLY